MNNSEVADRQHRNIKPVLTTDIEPTQRLMPLYSLILHNDLKNEMHYVTMALTVCLGLSDTEATCKMLEAHTDGQALLIIEPLERAEFHYDQLHACGLVVSIEPAE